MKFSHSREETFISVFTKNFEPGLHQHTLLLSITFYCYGFIPGQVSQTWSWSFTNKHWSVNRIIEANKMDYFSTLFLYTTLHVSDRISLHHQKSWNCIHSNWYLSYYLCWLSASQQEEYDKYQLWWTRYQDSWWWTVSLSETCRVVYQNKVEKQCILLASIIRIYHDARSSECQIGQWVLKSTER